MENDFENDFEGGPWRSAPVLEGSDVPLIALHDSEGRLPDRQARALSTLFDEVDGTVTAQQLIEQLRMHDQTAVVALSKAPADADVAAILEKRKGAVPLVPLRASDCTGKLETKMTDSDKTSRGRRVIADAFFRDAQRAVMPWRSRADCSFEALYLYALEVLAKRADEYEHPDARGT